MTGAAARKSLTLRAELVFFQVFVLSGLLLASPVVYFYLSRTLSREIDEHLAYLARNLMGQLQDIPAGTVGPDRRPAPCATASDVETSSEPAAAVVHPPRHLLVTDAAGRVVCSDGEEQPLATTLASKPGETPPPEYSDVRVAGETLRLMAWPFRDRSGRSLMMEVGVSKLIFENALKGDVALLVGMNLAAVALLVLGSHYILARRAFTPLGQIVSRVEQIDEDSLAERIPQEQGSNELERLAAVINRMLERLERAFEAQHRFSSDVSHEIRSPLTALRGEIEVALRKERSVSEYQRVLAESLEEVLRLSRIAEDLMSLAQADAGVLEMRREEVDLKALLVGVLHRLTSEADDKDIQLELDASDDVLVSGDSIWLERLVENIVRNAILHSPHISTVRVALHRKDRKAAVAVMDVGEGIPPEHLPHVFERFYRVDQSRSRNHGGAGLGLAIARQIAILHGGTIKVESTYGKGSTFVVELPFASPRPAAPKNVKAI